MTTDKTPSNPDDKTAQAKARDADLVSGILNKVSKKTLIDYLAATISPEEALKVARS